MDNEIRFVHREETFNDLAVRELAAGRSACICRLQFGRCTRSECQACSIAKQYTACYNQLTDYDKQRLATYINEQYKHDSLYPQNWMSYKGLCLNIIKWFIIGIVCFLLLILPLAMLGAQPMNAYGIDHELENKIMLTSREVNRQVTDLNKDGLINCIDYTCLWKIIWDRRYPDAASIATIIRIKNDRIHHLCIGIYDDYSNMILVETQVINRNYFVSYWYAGLFNKQDIIYGETKKWLSEVKEE